MRLRVRKPDGQQGSSWDAAWEAAGRAQFSLASRVPLSLVAHGAVMGEESTVAAQAVEDSEDLHQVLDLLDRAAFPDDLRSQVRAAQDLIVALYVLRPGWVAHVEATHQALARRVSPDQPGAYLAMCRAWPSTDTVLSWPDADAARTALPALVDPLLQLQRALVEFCGADLTDPGDAPVFPGPRPNTQDA